MKTIGVTDYRRTGQTGPTSRPVFCQGDAGNWSYTFWHESLFIFIVCVCEQRRLHRLLPASKPHELAQMGISFFYHQTYYTCAVLTLNNSDVI